jgi:hypothetical protein
MTSRLSLSALLLGACSGAHLPPVPAPSSVPSSSSGMRPWECVTPVGSISVELPEAHGLPLVGISATVLVAGARVTTSCERTDARAPASVPASVPASAAPDAEVPKLAAPESAP